MMGTNEKHIDSYKLDIDITGLDTPQDGSQVFLSSLLFAIELYPNFCEVTNYYNNCLKCFEKYYLSGSTCYPCHQSCLNCNGSSSNNCTECPQSYYLTANTCQPCHQNCLSCDGASQNNCIICKQPYQFISPQQGNVCVVECDLNIGQYIDTSNPLQKYCQSCFSNCQNCQNSTTCTQCYQSFYNTGSSCLPCHGSCLTCSGPSQNNCTQCRENYYQTGSTCLPCHESCQSCNGTSLSNCIICKQPYQYISIKQNNACVVDCDLSVGQYIDSSNAQQKYCKSCLSNCQTCSNQNTCTQCSQSFYYTGTACSPCHSSCFLCNGSTQNNCTQCKQKNYLSSNTCFACHASCLSCNGSSPSNCIICDQPYQYISSKANNICVIDCDTSLGQYIDSSNPQQKYCYSCLSNCQTCSNPSTCTQCFESFYYTGSICSPCHESCLSCNGPSQSNCLKCKQSSQYISTRQNNQCVADCDLTIGQYIDSSNIQQKYCRSCLSNCQTCQNENTCTQCYQQFYYTGSICSPCHLSCLNCNGPSQNNCTQCPQSYYLSGNTCLPCHGSCLSCNGSSQNDCTICKSQYQYISTKQNNICVVDCDLSLGQYIDNSNIQQKYCKSCLSNCQTCQNSTTCTQCNQSFFYTGTACSSCHESCQSCDGPSQNQCITCNQPYQYISSNQNDICVIDCDLSIGQYIDSSNPQQKYCKSCISNCQHCQNSTTCTQCYQQFYYTGTICSPCHQNCLQCNGPSQNQCTVCLDGSQYISTLLNNICVSSCDLENGFYVDSSNSQQKYCKQCQSLCKTCSNGTSCDSCQEREYLNSNNLCQPCHDTCQSCNGSLNTNCQICFSGLMKQLSTNKCVLQCKTNEFINSNNQCEECDINCATCDRSSNKNCLSCYQNTFLFNKMCVNLCPNGFQSNFSSLACDSCQNYLSPACNPCDPSCQLCNQAQINSSQCQSCYSETRILDSINNKCVCQNIKDQRSIFYQCSYKNIAVLDAYLSGSFPLLSIDFGSPIQIIDTSTYSPLSLCQYLFDESTNQIFGQDSYCQIQGNFIIIQLGESSTVMENDLLTFLPNKLKFEDYSNDFINIFYRNFVNQKPSGNPYLEFNYNYEENSCNPVNITLSQITNDAKRKFLHLNWTLEQFNGSDEQQKKLLEILKAASQNKNTSLLIEPQFIPPNQNITFKFSYLLKVNKTGSQVFTIFYLKQKIIRISYQQSNYPPLYRYMGLSFYIQFYVEVCQLGEIAYYHEPVDMQIDSSQLPSLSLSSYNSSSYQYDILPFSLASNQTLNTTFRVNLSSDKKVISVQNISVDILITNLQLQIEGGSSLIVGFQNKLELNTVYRDYEIEDANSPQNIRFTWSCYGLSFSDHLCYDFSNKIIELQQDVSSLSFPAKTFSPYTIIVLTISGSKDSRETTSSTTCIFTELDIPSLLVKYQPSQQSSKINLNEDLDFTIVYGGNISSDVLSYAGALLYQNNVVGTIKFDYFQVKLRVWNYYQNIIPGQPTIQIRFSVYNPSYVMPSLSTLSFIVNIPPSNCDLIVEPMQGIALQTVFSIELLNCNDEDLPLTYQFFYYNNEDDAKQELVSPWNITRRQIQDQSVKKSIKTILPQGNLTIMGQVMDCQFGISNKTLKIEVQSQNKLVDPYFFIANNLVQQALSIQSSNQYADQIINLSIIGEDLSKQQFSFSQKISQLQSFLIETIQKLTEQLPKFSLLNTFANKVIAELSKQLFDSQQNDYSTQKKDIFNQLQKIILETKQSVTNNKQSTLEQNNDVSMQNVIDSFKILNSSVTLSSKNSFEDFEEYDQISSQIGLLLTNMSLPNQGQLILQGNFSSLLADKITEKNMFQYTLPFEGQNSQNKTNIYSITRNNYKINIYENTTSFLEYTQSIKNISSDFVFSKNQLISTLIYNSDQSQLGFSNLNAQDGSNKIKNVLRGLQNVKSTVKNTDLENTSLDLNEDVSIIYQFDNVIQSDKYKMTCLQQSQTKWNKDNCGFYQKDKNNYMCFCNKQQPVTIIEDIDDMFTKNKNLQTAFGEQGFENISNFNNFYLYLSFWSLFTFSLAQVAFYFIGKYLDQKSFSKKFQQIHIEQPNKSDKSNEQQEQSQEQEQKKIEMNDKQLSVIPELNDQNESKISNQVTFNQNPLEQQIEDQQCAAGQEKLDSKTSSDQTTAKKLITITEQPTLISLTQFNQQNAEVNNLNEKNNESTENNNIKKIEEETPSSEVNPQIENTETQDEQEKSQLEQIYSKLSKYKKLLIFHQLLSIFYLYDTTMPRPMRFTLIYIKIIHTLAIAVLFAGYTKFFQQLIIALLNSILLQTFSFLIIFAFKRGSKGKYISTFLQIGISLSYYYIILAVSSGKSPGESNQFMILFIVSVIFEQIVTEFLMCYLKNVLVLKYISSNEEEEENIYKKLFGFLDLQQTLLSIDL